MHTFMCTGLDIKIVYYSCIKLCDYTILLSLISTNTLQAIVTKDYHLMNEQTADSNLVIALQPVNN